MTAKIRQCNSVALALIPGYFLTSAAGGLRACFMPDDGLSLHWLHGCSWTGTGNRPIRSDRGTLRFDRHPTHPACAKQLSAPAVGLPAAEFYFAAVRKPLPNRA